jgi:hypothetical protein
MTELLQAPTILEGKTSDPVCFVVAKSGTAGLGR